MSCDVRLESIALTPLLKNVLENLEIADHMKKHVLSAQASSVTVTTKPPTILIQLLSNHAIEKPALEALSQSLSETWDQPSPPRIVWDLHYPNGQVSALAYLQEHWQDLLVVFSKEVNMAAAYLSLVRFQALEEGKIKIALANKMSLAALKKQEGDKKISRLLSERLQREIQVKFELGNFEEEVKHREALYEQRIREELERMQQEKDLGPQSDGQDRPHGGKPQKAAWKLVFGRSIAGQPRPIKEINEEEKNVVFEGELVAFEKKVLRTGRQLVLMDIYDKTSSINARMFVDAEQQVSSEIKCGAYVRIKGSVQTDKYSQDLCMMVNSVMVGEKERRHDLMAAQDKRVELHAHSQMSAMDALPEVKQLVAKAAEFGHPAVAITDHGVVQGFPEAMAAASAHGLKVIYGVESYLIEDEWLKDKKPKRPYHIVILVKEFKGLRNLYRLTSEAHLKYFYRHPRIPRSLLEKYREGLIFGTACEQGELYRRLLEGANDQELAVIAGRYDYVEIMPNGNNQFLIRNGVVKDDLELQAINKRLVAIAQSQGRPVVATGDVHFLEPGDEIFRCILQAGQGYDDAAQQAPLYFHTTEEMLKEFDYLGEPLAKEVVIQGPQKVAGWIEKIEPLKLDFYPPKLPDAEAKLEKMALSRAHEIYGTPLPEVVDQRLKREITAINHNKFASLFLIARELVQKSLADGYLVGSRGSVGSSLTATMLGITEVNPLPGHYLCTSCRHVAWDVEGRMGADLPDEQCPVCGLVMSKQGMDIPFEVFMGFKGDKTPDIDLNFSGEYQSRAHKFLEELFDADHIFRAGTISTVADRTAYGFVKKYLDDNKLVLREAEINRLTRGCAGVKKTTGQHPGGIMIVPADMSIYDFTPVQRPADDKNSDVVTTHLDYHAIHDALLKLDVLGHDDPTSLRRLGDWTGVDVRSIPLDDPETLKIFSGLDSLGLSEADIHTGIGTLGIPEFGTEFVRQMLDITKPKAFSELVRISGLSHGTDVWLNNAADLIKAGTATLSTVISARDDIMNYLISKDLEPSLAFKIMESVRKGKGLTPEWETAMKNHKVPEWYIESCNKIKYMFPKAHAVAYCIMAFRIAYFKVHFPTAFYANYFSLNAESFDAQLVVFGGLQGVNNKLKELKGRQDLTAKDKNAQTVLEVVREAFARGIEFKPVNMAISAAETFKILGDKQIIPPLISLNGLGLTCAKKIVQERELRLFRSVEDLSKRTGANKNVIEIMTQHGCLTVLPASDQTSLF